MVNETLARIRVLGSLADASKYDYSSADVDLIFTALHDELTTCRGSFAKSLGRRGRRFRLDAPHEGDSNRFPPAKERWRTTFEGLVAKRDVAILKVRGRGKLFYSDPGADYFTECVARTMHLKPKPPSVDTHDWLVTNPDQVVFIDTRKVVRKVEPTLRKAPQQMIRGRLVSMARYAPEMKVVGCFKLPVRLASRRRGSWDPAYGVVLYRQSRPLDLYSRPSSLPKKYENRSPRR